MWAEWEWKGTPVEGGSLWMRGVTLFGIREGRLVAARIPGAQFVELPGRNHVLIESEPAWPLFLQELGKFMGWKETAETRG